MNMDDELYKNAQRSSFFIYRQANHWAPLQRLRSQGTLCDVTIQTGNQSFRAHRVVLAASISYFEKMFTSGFKERDNDTVYMADINPENLKAFIDFAYTGEILIKDDNVNSMLKDSDYLELIDVRHKCLKILPNLVNFHNVFKNYQTAQETNHQSLRVKCMNILKEHFIQISKISDEFLHIEYDFFKTIISHESLKFVPKVLVFEAVVKWITHNLEERKHYLFNLLQRLHAIESKIRYLTHNILESSMSQSSENEPGDLLNQAQSLYARYAEQNVFSDAFNYFCNSGHAAGHILISTSPNLMKFYSYDVFKDKWKDANILLDSSPLKFSFSGRTVHNNKLYIIEGMMNLDSTSSSWVYDLHNNEWKKISSMSKIRRSTAVAILDDFLYVCGGYEYKPRERGLKTVERFNLKTKNWEVISSMNQGRIGASAAVFDGYIYVLGGYDGYDVLKSVERYDPRTDQWTVLNSMKLKRYDFGACWFDGKLYVCGGYLEYESLKLDSFEVYDPILNSWKEVASLRTERCCVLLLANSGKIWAIGDRDHHRCVEVYDPELNSWHFAHLLPDICDGSPLVACVATIY